MDDTFNLVTYHFVLCFIISGYYCVPELVVVGDASSTYLPCPQGFYCPNGTGHDWQPCPAGTYGMQDGRSSLYPS